MQNTFSQSGNDSKWFSKKSFFRIGMWNSRPPPFMAKTILNFHFDYWNPSLSYYHIKSGTSITSLPNQNTTITSLSNLVAHLVKLIPGGREERLFGLLAEWHKA